MTSALAIYVLPDYAAKRLAKAHPQKLTVNRIGLTTSKTLGGAVVRTRCRRLMREAMRLIIKDKPVKVGFLIVIAARHGMLQMKMGDVKRDLNYALKKLDMYRTEI